MNKTIVIYDSDAIAYRAAAVVDKRVVDIKHIKSGREKTFNTRTELKDLLKSKEKVFNKEEYEFTDRLIPGELSHAIAIMKNQVEKINSDLFADEMLMCIQGTTNFRDRLPLPKQYKHSRASTLRPTWLRECKLYLYKNYPSLVAKDFEVDDAVIFKGYEYLNKGYTPVIVGVDKDAQAYSGLNLYDYTQDNPVMKLVPEFGSLWVDNGKKVKGDGFIWFCFQILNGDSSDDYKPCELAGVKFGEASAFKLLKNCRDEQEALQVVVKKYQEWYPEDFTYRDWTGSLQRGNFKIMIDLYFKCSRMMTHKNDTLDSVEFFNKYGVRLA